MQFSSTENSVTVFLTPADRVMEATISDKAICVVRIFSGYNC